MAAIKSNRTTDWWCFQRADEPLLSPFYASSTDVAPPDRWQPRQPTLYTTS